MVSTTFGLEVHYLVLSQKQNIAIRNSYALVMITPILTLMTITAMWFWRPI